MKRKTVKYYSLPWVATILSAMLVAASAYAMGGKQFTAYGTPVGHEKYMVLMANGIYDPQDTDYTPPDFDYFAHEVMGWNDSEISSFEESARNFFEQRFGVDVSDPRYAGRVMMVPFMLDPRWEYRVYNSSAEFVPQNGWVVRDGGYQLVVVDPEGVTLGGEFDGHHANMGALAAFGKYSIVRGPGNSPRKSDLIIHYQSREPVLQNSGFPMRRTGNGALIAPLEVIHPEHGEGWGFAYISDVVFDDGRRQTHNRNIMTFPSGAAFPEWMQ
jgi:roadblock/LC7 domain-containing protein